MSLSSLIESLQIRSIFPNSVLVSGLITGGRSFQSTRFMTEKKCFENDSKRVFKSRESRPLTAAATTEEPSDVKISRDESQLKKIYTS